MSVVIFIQMAEKMRSSKPSQPVLFNSGKKSAFDEFISKPNQK